MTAGDDDILQALRSPDEENRRKAIFLAAQRMDQRALPQLQAIAADDPSIEVRYYAKKALLFMQQGSRRGAEGGGLPESAGAELASALAAADPKRRNEAVQALARAGGPEARERLLAHATREQDPFVKATLAISLGIVGTPADLAVLDGYLKDKDPRVRANAIEGLMHMGVVDAPRLIAPHLKDEDNRVKVNAYTALGKFRKLDLLKALGDMLESEKVWLRDSAAYALVKLEIPESVALLEHALSDEYMGIRLKARNGLVLLAKKGVSQAEKALERAGGERAAPEAFLTMSMISPRARPRPAKADPVEGRLQLIRRIVEAEDREKLRMLILQLGKEKSPRVLATLITAVGKLGDGRSLAAVAPFLGSPDRRIRANAVEAVGLLAPAPRKALLEAFLHDPDNRVRANAIVALGDEAGAGVTGALEGMVVAVEERMRLSAVYALVELRREEHLGLLERLLQDPVPQVRKKAVDSLRILASEGLAGAAGILRQAGLPADSMPSPN